MTRFRSLLIALLMLALPVQGAVASSRWLCAAMTPATSDAVMHARHAAHVHVMDDAHAPSGQAHQAPTGAEHGFAGTHAHPAGAHDETSPISQDTGCNLCAACSVTAATPPASIVLAATAASDASFPALDAPVPHGVADGLERPPRTL